MFFKSYDGWKQFESYNGNKLIMAHFTKYDDTVARYCLSALADKIKKVPPAMKQADLALMQQAIDEQSEFLQSYLRDSIKGKLTKQFTSSDSAPCLTPTITRCCQPVPCP